MGNFNKKYKQLNLLSWSALILSSYDPPYNHTVHNRTSYVTHVSIDTLSPYQKFIDLKDNI